VRSRRYSLSDIRLSWAPWTRPRHVLPPTRRPPNGPQTRTEQRSGQSRARPRARPHREQEGKDSDSTPSLRLVVLLRSESQIAQRSAPIEVSTPLPAPPPPSSSPYTAPPKRRRVPITIVEGSDGPSQPSPSASDAQPSDDLLNPISSRVLTPSMPPDVNSPAPAPVPPTQQPKPPSFREAKQVREAKSAGRVGGGVFRMSGNDTLFKTREVPAPAVADPPKHPVPAPAPAPAPPPPRTLFEFTRAWEHTPASDTAARWALLNVRAPPLFHPCFSLKQLHLSLPFVVWFGRRSLRHPYRRSSAPRSNLPSSPPSSPCSLPPPLPPLRRPQSGMKPRLAMPSGRSCVR
jgi:hypothetical protein